MRKHVPFLHEDQIFTCHCFLVGALIGLSHSVKEKSTKEGKTFFLRFFETLYFVKMQMANVEIKDGEYTNTIYSLIKEQR